MNKGKICVFGSFVVDLTSYAPRIPGVGETVLGTAFKLGPGGKGSNQGVAAHRAGGDVTMITKVGKDVFGQVALDNFKNEGMSLDYIFVDSNHETGSALIMVDENSSNSILVVPGACNTITDEEVDSAKEVISDCDIFLAQLEVNMSSIERSVKLAHEGGATVVLNTAPVQPVSDELIAMCDIVTPNEHEAAILTGIEIKTIEDCRAAAKFFFDKGVKKVIITWGSNGVYCNDGEKEMHLPITPYKAIDTTGAGDAFSGGFVTALSEGKNFFEAAAFGCVVAGLSVTKKGTAASMPNRNEVDKALEECKELYAQALNQ